MNGLDKKIDDFSLADDIAYLEKNYGHLSQDELCVIRREGRGGFFKVYFKAKDATDSWAEEKHVRMSDALFKRVLENNRRIFFQRRREDYRFEWIRKAAQSEKKPNKILSFWYKYAPLGFQFFVRNFLESIRGESYPIYKIKKKPNKGEVYRSGIYEDEEDNY